jgi:hypothetical protein
MVARKFHFIPIHLGLRHPSRFWAKARVAESRGPMDGLTLYTATNGESLSGR